MSNEGNEENDGRTTTRITSGSTWRGIHPGEAVVGGTKVGHTPGTSTRIRQRPRTYGKDWYGLSDDERHATSQLCYSRRTWDSYEALLLGEHLMERPNFHFTDWHAVDDAIRDAAGNGLKY